MTLQQQEPELTPQEKCLTPNCGKVRKWKGLCRSCYGQALQLIDKAITTWEELSEMKLVVIEKKAFYDAFESKKKEQRPK
jgi:hypothetical protein